MTAQDALNKILSEHQGTDISVSLALKKSLDYLPGQTNAQLQVELSSKGVIKRDGNGDWQWNDTPILNPAPQPSNGGLTSVRFTPEFVVFKKLESDGSYHGIVRTETKMVIKGVFLDEPSAFLGQEMLFHGDYVVDKKFGEQFAFKSYSLGSEKEELEFFLNSMVKGVSKKAANAIVKKYDFEQLDLVITLNPSELTKIKGIGPKSLGKIQQTWTKFRSVRVLASYLAPYGVTNKKIIQIYNFFGDSSIEVIRENPYRLIEIRGIGFKVADEIAHSMGIPVDSDYRITSGVSHVVEQEMLEKGHTYLSAPQIYKSACEILNTEDQNGFLLTKHHAWDILCGLGDKQEVIPLPGSEKIIKGGLFTTPLIYNVEKEVYEILKQNSAPKESKASAKVVENLIASLNFPPNEKQVEAIYMASTLPQMFSVNGFAGTGKTTISIAIIDMLIHMIGAGKDCVHCAALSGVAANRIKEATSFQSKTIHSLLGFSDGEWEFNEDNPLPYDVVVIDEMSMVDLFLFWRLLKSIDFSKTYLIMLGDPGQIESVGLGDVFKNIIDYSIIPNTTLVDIRRTDIDSNIPIMAEGIRLGFIPEGFFDVHDDFEYVNVSQQDKREKKRALSTKEYREYLSQHDMKVLQTLKKDVNCRFTSEYLNISNKNKITFFQCLSPKKAGILGVDNLNIQIQSILNPKSETTSLIISPEKDVRVNDKIVHLENEKMQAFNNGNEIGLKIADTASLSSEEEKVNNGQIGVVIDINVSEKQVLVHYPIEEYFVIYKDSDFASKKVDLAYALTMHKTQGAQYQYVVAFMMDAHYYMLNSRLGYTFMTRAVKHLKIFGQQGALKQITRPPETTCRQTLISFWEGYNLQP